MKTLLCLAAATTLLPASARLESNQIEPSLKLMTVEEVRRTVIFESPDAPGFFMNEPGLRLTFDVLTPDNIHIMSFTQPTDLRASDSQGTDLTDIEPNFYDEKEYLTSTSMGDDAVSSLTLNLSLPARTATSFNVEGSFTATTYSGVADRSFEVGSQWVSLNPDQFNGQSARLRFGPMKDFGGETWSVVFEPASVQDMIEEIIIDFEGDEVESDGWMSDGRRVQYMFEEDFEEDEPVIVNLKVRTGLSEITLRLNEEKRALP